MLHEHHDAQALRREVELLKTALATVTEERDKLRRAYEQLKEHLELLRRRIFQAKAERIDITQLELEFAETKQKLDAMAKHAESDPSLEAVPDALDFAPEDAPPPSGARPRPNRSGRRDLRDEYMPEERIEIADPAMAGKGKPIGFEESCRYSYRRGGPVRVVVARVKYKRVDAEGREIEEEVDEHGRKTGAVIITAPMQIGRASCRERV